MESKEDKILFAAQKLFFRHGLRKVSMSDIAEAADMSRPSLYAAFTNKEAVILGIIHQHIEMNHAETAKLLQGKKTLKAQLNCLFDVWIIRPFASAIDSEGGREMMATIGEFSPKGIDEIYATFEKYVIEILRPVVKKDASLSVKDLAHILAMATKGLKASSSSTAELERLVGGLVSMTLAMVKDE